MVPSPPGLRPRGFFLCILPGKLWHQASWKIVCFQRHLKSACAALSGALKVFVYNDIQGHAEGTILLLRRIGRGQLFRGLKMAHRR